MTAIPSNPDTPLNRKQLAAALTEAGFPITATALGGLAHLGTGPKYAMFGKYAMYRWGDALAWANALLSDPRASASELEAARAERKAELKAARAERKAAWAAERKAATAASHPTAAE